MRLSGEGEGGRRRWIIRAAIAVTLISLFAFRDHLPSVNLEELVKSLSESLGKWTYALVGGLAFLETGAFVGLVAPGEFTVLLGGAVAGQGEISLPLILAITWFAAFSGDSVSFALGRKLGREFVIRHGERVRIDESRLRQVEDYFERHGGKTILIGRFIGLVRALAPFIAGSSNMRYRAFAPYSVLGTGIWATILILLGYFASQSLDTVAQIVSRSLIGFGFIVFTVIGVVAAVRFLRVKRNRQRLERSIHRRPALRPALAAAKRLRPQAEFLFQRITPGGLGLELTTMFAIAAVGGYALVSYWSVVSGSPAPTGADSAALDLADRIRSGFLDDLARAVTHLGDGSVVLAVALGVGVWLLAAGLRAEALVMALGLVIVLAAPDLIKDATDRPRPAGGLAESGDSAFPSGHATAATFYSWLAIAIAVRAVPGITRRSAVIAAGIGLTALVGLSRIYLRVHWLSDVTAGWGLGFAAFALVTAAVMVAAHIRHNPADDRTGDGDAAGR